LDRNQEAPTFYQPVVGRSQQGFSGGLSGEEEEEEEEDDSEAASLKRLNQLPEEERYKAIGKMWALKIWPWASPNWWIVNTSGGPRIRGREDDLDSRMKSEFITFLGIDMGMSSDEWMHPKFRREVILFCTIYN
jgi:hypothetical protein